MPRVPRLTIGRDHPCYMSRIAHSDYAFDDRETGRSRRVYGEVGKARTEPDGSGEVAVQGEDGGFGAGGDVELGQDGAHVLGCGARADEERIGNLAVSATSRQEP